MSLMWMNDSWNGNVAAVSQGRVFETSLTRFGKISYGFWGLPLSLVATNRTSHASFDEPFITNLPLQNKRYFDSVSEWLTTFPVSIILKAFEMSFHENYKEPPLSTNYTEPFVAAHLPYSLFVGSPPNFWVEPGLQPTFRSEFLKRTLVPYCEHIQYKVSTASVPITDKIFLQNTYRSCNV